MVVAGVETLAVGGAEELRQRDHGAAHSRAGEAAAPGPAGTAAD